MLEFRSAFTGYEGGSTESYAVTRIAQRNFNEEMDILYWSFEARSFSQIFAGHSFPHQSHLFEHSTWIQVLNREQPNRMLPFADSVLAGAQKTT